MYHIRTLCSFPYNIIVVHTGREHRPLQARSETRTKQNSAVDGSISVPAATNYQSL